MPRTGTRTFAGVPRSGLAPGIIQKPAELWRASILYCLAKGKLDYPDPQPAPRASMICGPARPLGAPELGNRVVKFQHHSHLLYNKIYQGGDSTND
jgi:hypothetical protein